MQAFEQGHLGVALASLPKLMGGLDIFKHNSIERTSWYTQTIRSSGDISISHPERRTRAMFYSRGFIANEQLWLSAVATITVESIVLQLMARPFTRTLGYWLTRGKSVINFASVYKLTSVTVHMSSSLPMCNLGVTGCTRTGNPQ